MEKFYSLHYGHFGSHGCVFGNFRLKKNAIKEMRKFAKSIGCSLSYNKKHDLYESAVKAKWFRIDEEFFEDK